MIDIAKVSVIVPVYNSEKYLDRCIKSILNQKLEDMEVILVNDGSTDKSLEIIKKYAKESDRIKIINKPNKGVSSARNSGIDAAGGDYIGFVDADDWIHPDMYKNMYEKITKTQSDICICNYIVEYPDHSRKMILNTKKTVLDKKNQINRLILNMISPKDLNINSYSIMGSACRLLIKRDLIMENNIRFPIGIHLMEDLIFCIEAFIKCKKIVIDKGFYYHYFIDTVTSKRKDINMIHKNVNNILERIIKENNLYKMAEPRLNIRYINMCLNLISHEVQVSNEKKFSDKLKTIRNICEDKKLKNILIKTKTRNLKLRKKLVLIAIKHELSVFLYIYFKMVFYKKKLSSRLWG